MSTQKEDSFGPQMERYLAAMTTDEFSPRAAIVTGSDSGIGRATAVALARAGMDVGVTWHSDEPGAQQTAEEVRGLGRPAWWPDWTPPTCPLAGTSSTA